MRNTTRSKLLAWAACAGLLLCSGAAPAATIVAGGSGVADCTFWCVERLQQVYDASQFSGLTNISQVSFVAAPANGSSWNGTSSWQMSLSTSQNPVGLLDLTFANNVGPDNAVFDTITPAAGSPPPLSLVSFNGSFVYDPSQGDLLVDIVRTSGVGFGVGSEAQFNAGGISRVYAYNNSVTADYAGPDFYGAQTVFETNPVPEPSTMLMLALGGLGSGVIVRHKQARRKA